MEIFQDIEGLVFKRLEIHVEIQDMEKFQDMEIILYMKVKPTITRSYVRQHQLLLINSMYLRCRCSVICFNLDKLQ